jgi:hypothetical protein
MVKILKIYDGDTLEIADREMLENWCKVLWRGIWQRHSGDVSILIATTAYFSNMAGFVQVQSGVLPTHEPHSPMDRVPPPMSGSWSASLLHGLSMSIEKPREKELV